MRILVWLVLSLAACEETPPYDAIIVLLETDSSIDQNVHRRRLAYLKEVTDYYDANRQLEWLLAEGETEASIGGHAGIRDTSELLAAHPAGIRQDRLGKGMADGFEISGVDGDPTRASASRGEVLLQLKVDAAVGQIRRALSD